MSLLLCLAFSLSVLAQTPCGTPKPDACVSKLVRMAVIADTLFSDNETPQSLVVEATPQPTPIVHLPAPRTRRDLTPVERATLLNFWASWRDGWGERDFENCVLYPAELTLPPVMIEYLGEPAIRITSDEGTRVCWQPYPQAGLGVAPQRVARAPTPSMPRRNRAALLAEFNQLGKECGALSIHHKESEQ